MPERNVRHDQAALLEDGLGNRVGEIRVQFVHQLQKQAHAAQPGRRIAALLLLHHLFEQAGDLRELLSVRGVRGHVQPRTGSREGERLGDDGLWTNISGLQGPGLNLHTAAYCGRAHEYYFEDAMLTNRMASEFITGTWSKGTWSVLKHFAMNDMEFNRTGLATFFTEQSASENGLRAFQGPVTNESLAGVMTTYNRIGTVFSGGHEGLVRQILLTEWEHKGWVMTDYAAAGFDYMNWLDNIYAGGGALLCTTANYSSSNHGSMSDARNQEALLADTAFQHEMQEAIKHYMYQFANSNAMNGLSPDTKVVHVTTWWEKAFMGMASMESAQGYLVFAGVGVAAWIVSVIAAFSGIAKKAA